MKRFSKNDILVYSNNPFFVGYRQHKTHLKLTIHPDFRGKLEKCSLIQVPITGFSCTTDIRTLTCHYWVQHTLYTVRTLHILCLVLKTPLRHMRYIYITTDSSPH